MAAAQSTDRVKVPIARHLDEVSLGRPACVAIGSFDGVHRGHQRLIGQMVEEARRGGWAAAVVTFDPRPGALLGRSPTASLSTIEERAEALAPLDVDLLLVLRFTPVLAGMPAARFVRLLHRRLHLVGLWAGPDFALGHRREGDIPFLRNLGREMGFQVHVVEPLVWQGRVISSTRIRESLAVGDVEDANGCLGRPYRLSGTVVRGRGLGHRLGVPTANLAPPLNRLIPANGVYACTAHLEGGEVWPAVTNIGVRPTIGADQLTVEAHLLDFDGDLYDRWLGLDFIARLRDEMTFPSLNALVTQIRRDVRRARGVLGDWEAG